MDTPQASTGLPTTPDSEPASDDIAAAVPDEFDCTQDRHDWSSRGSEGDRWLECWLCGVTVDDPDYPNVAEVRTPQPVKPPCRSVGPSGQPCVRLRNHTPQWHTGVTPDGVTENWTAGVNAPAVVYVRVPGPQRIPGGCRSCGSTKRRTRGGSSDERNPGVCARCLDADRYKGGPQSEADFLTWGNPRNGW